MDGFSFDSPLMQYKTVIDHCIQAIRNEESLATSDHSMVEMEKWDDVEFAVQDAESVAKKARDQYKKCIAKKELRLLGASAAKRRNYWSVKPSWTFPKF